MLFVCLCLISIQNDFEKILSMPPAEAREKLGEDVGEFAIDLVVDHGRHKDALTFLDQQIALAQGEKLLALKIDKAWVLYLQGGLNEALNLVDEVLLTADDPLLVARAKYMVGGIHVLWREDAIAESFFKEALSIYRKINKSGGERKCLVELYNLTGDPKYKVTQVSDDRNFLLSRKALRESMNLFNEQKYESALERAQYAMALSEKDQTMKMWSKYVIGICYAALGNYDLSLKFANEVDKHTKRESLRTLEHFNLVTFALRRKCQGYGYKILLNKISTYADEAGLDSLNEEVEWIKQFNCEKP